MPPRVSARRTRRAGGVFRLKKPTWIDPFPGIPGTKPEKRIFEVLVRRRIFFVFQGDLPLADRVRSPLLQLTGFKPDIIVPEYRVIFDPFGDFAHTQPDSLQRDFIKSVLYTALGYEFIHPWSSDIEHYGGDWVVDQSERLRGPKLEALSPDLRPFLALGYKLGENLGLGATGTAAGNTARARPKTLSVSRGTRRNKR